MGEPLKIFEKEMLLDSFGSWIVSIGLMQFRISSTSSGSMASINGIPVMNVELGVPMRFANERHAAGFLEYEGRRVAREMIMMAGEMVTRKPVFGYSSDCTQKLQEEILVRFKNE